MVMVVTVERVKWRRMRRWWVGWDWGRKKETGWSFVVWELGCAGVEWECVG